MHRDADYKQKKIKHTGKACSPFQHAIDMTRTILVAAELPRLDSIDGISLGTRLKNQLHSTIPCSAKTHVVKVGLGSVRKTTSRWHKRIIGIKKFCLTRAQTDEVGFQPMDLSAYLPYGIVTGYGAIDLRPTRSTFAEEIQKRGVISEPMLQRSN